MVKISNRFGIRFLFCFIIFLIISCNYYASAEVLFGDEYQQSLHKYLSQADSSITMAMYFICCNFEDDSNPINQLLTDLVEAQKRGLDVKLVLEGSKLALSRQAYQFLKENGVDVYFDTAAHVLHIKSIVIDNRYVFIGSANWSRSAIERNYEATYFTESLKEANELTNYINSIPLQEGLAPIPCTQGVSLSKDFLFSPDLGRQLLKSQADKQFDLYLLLCKIQQETGSSEINIDYESLAKQMGYAELDDIGGYRSQYHYFWQRIHHLLSFLEKYGLIEYQKEKVNLIGNNPNSPSIIIPFEYWDYGYADTLSMRMKYAYLICLCQASNSSSYPMWFESQKNMAKIYGIDAVTISKGLCDLEDVGLIEVTRDKAPYVNWEDRRANEYKMLPLGDLRAE
jgi:cardiolipin synthase